MVSFHPGQLNWFSMTGLAEMAGAEASPAGNSSPVEMQQPEYLFEKPSFGQVAGKWGRLAGNTALASNCHPRRRRKNAPHCRHAFYRTYLHSSRVVMVRQDNACEAVLAGIHDQDIAIHAVDRPVAFSSREEREGKVRFQWEAEAHPQKAWPCSAGLLEWDSRWRVIK